MEVIRVWQILHAFEQKQLPRLCQLSSLALLADEIHRAILGQWWLDCPLVFKKWPPEWSSPKVACGPLWCMVRFLLLRLPSIAGFPRSSIFYGREIKDRVVVCCTFTMLGLSSMAVAFMLLHASHTCIWDVDGHVLLACILGPAIASRPAIEQAWRQSHAFATHDSDALRFSIRIVVHSYAAYTSSASPQHHEILKYYQRTGRAHAKVLQNPVVLSIYLQRSSVTSSADCVSQLGAALCPQCPAIKQDMFCTSCCAWHTW